MGLRQHTLPSDHTKPHPLPTTPHDPTLSLHHTHDSISADSSKLVLLDVDGCEVGEEAGVRGVCQSRGRQVQQALHQHVALTAPFKVLQTRHEQLETRLRHVHYYYYIACFSTEGTVSTTGTTQACFSTF